MTQRNAMLNERDEGRAEGRAVGRAEGLAEGEKKGIEKGAKQANIATARSMKADGLHVDVIAKYTGLTPSEITSL
jgi:predicted transposase/invertase (TIGR01784 family)